MNPGPVEHNYNPSVWEAEVRALIASGQFTFQAE